MKSHPTSPSPRFLSAFSLVEVMVAMAIMSVILLMISSMLGDVGDIWKRGRARVSQFREARTAFETMCQSLSQATLAPYWDYDYLPGRQDIPYQFSAQSDLLFVSGPASEIINSADAQISSGQAVFFTFPLGRTNHEQWSSFRHLFNLCGYFVSFTDGQDFLPDEAVSSGMVPRPRFRLMEYVQPTEDLSLFLPASQAETGAADEKNRSLPWNTEGFSNHLRTVAENILYLAIIPLPRPDPDGDPNFIPKSSFDSRQRDHDLPPRLRLIMVAASEDSGEWLAESDEVENLIPSNLFTQANEDKIDEDLERLRDHLQKEFGRKLDYRVFDSTIQISASKWNP